MKFKDYNEFLQFLETEGLPVRYAKDADKFEEAHIEKSWTTGGLTGGSCWSGAAKDPRRADPEPEFDELDAILTKICPAITFLQYKAIITNLQATTNEEEVEYYGNSRDLTYKRISLLDLFNYLKGESLV